jgi:hypothetical protein
MSQGSLSQGWMSQTRDGFKVPAAIVMMDTERAFNHGS